MERHIRGGKEPLAPDAAEALAPTVDRYRRIGFVSSSAASASTTWLDDCEN